MTTWRRVEAWLFGHGLETPVMTIGRVSPEEKVKMDYDLYIDDSPKMVEPIRRCEDSSKLLLLLSQPWNASVDVGKDTADCAARGIRHRRERLHQRGGPHIAAAATSFVT